MKIKLYFRSLFLTLVILLCFAILLIGITKAYKSTYRIAYGEYKNAIEITDNSITLFEYKIKIPTLF